MSSSVSQESEVCARLLNTKDCKYWSSKVKTELQEQTKNMHFPTKPTKRTCLLTQLKITVFAYYNRYNRHFCLL